MSARRACPCGPTTVNWFERRRFLDLIRYFIVFEDMGGDALSNRRRSWAA
jgi:hypothetical protein